MSAPVDADAVWAVLEPLGWERKDIPSDHVPERWVPMSEITGRPMPAHDTKPSTEFSKWNGGLRCKIRYVEDGYINMQFSFGEWQRSNVVPGIAALSRLLGDTGQAAPDEVTHE